MSVSLLPKGTTFTRAAIAKAVVNGDPVAAMHYASNRWGANSGVVNVLREAVGGGSTFDEDYSALSGTRQAAAEFLEIVRPMTIVGRLQNLRRVPPRVPVVPQVTATTAYWVAEGSARPLSRTAFDREVMEALRIAALTVLSDELLRDASNEAESVIRRDLARACAQLLDLSFISPTNAGTVGKSPAAVTNGVTPISATGDIADDLEAAVGAFAGDLESAAWVMHPRVATQIGLRSGSVGADIGARGGNLAGLPAITSQVCPYGSAGGLITLLDASGVLYVDEGLEVKVSEHASIEMDDDPQGDTTTPSGGTMLVSMFQTDSVALMVERAVNWKALAGAVVTVSGASYGAA